MHPGSPQPSPQSLSPEQRQRLLKAKLTALSRDYQSVNRHDDGSDPLVEPEVRGALSASMTPGGHGFVLTDFGTPAAVAGAMSWAQQARSTAVTIFVDFDAPLAARFASYFKRSGVSDIAVEVRSVIGASSEPVDPEPFGSANEAPEAPSNLVDLLRANDLEVVTEHGITRGEILGLEVARLVVWPEASGGDGEVHLEVGVGRFDRDAVWAVNDGSDLRDALASTIEIVRKNRYPGAPAHSLQRLARERWVRSTVLRQPDLVGAQALEPVGMTIEAQGMKDPHPAGAVGVDDDGAPVVVVCSTGANLAVVPLAADLRASHEPEARLVIAVPATDAHPVQLRLASMLSPAAEIVPVPVEWG